MNPLLRFTLILCLLLGSGCDSTNPEATLQDYLDRVSNTVETDYANSNPYQDLQPFPDRRDRLVATTELRAGLLETLGFANCGLLPLIAERNSSLGKVMKPSTRLRYELRFFDLLAPCYRRLSTAGNLAEGEFLKLLQEVYRVKSTNLEAEVWNGLFTSEALERNFSLSRDPIPLTGNPGFGDSLRALQQAQRIADSITDYRKNQRFALPNGLEDLEQHYSALHNSEYGSQLIKSLALLSHYLNLTAGVLEQAIARRPLCFGQQPSAKAKILKNVFVKYYSAGVQPYMALVQRQGHDWLAQINELLTPDKLTVPDSVEQYRRHMLAIENKESLWSNYQRAIERHTQAWQVVLKQCGLMPGG